MDTTKIVSIPIKFTMTKMLYSDPVTWPKKIAISRIYRSQCQIYLAENSFFSQWKQVLDSYPKKQRKKFA